MVINKQELSALIERRVKKDFSVSVQDANDRQMYQAVVSVVRDILQQKRAETVAKADAQDAKQVYYMSMEFLVGRSLRNNLYNLGLENDIKDIVADGGKNLDTLYQMEPDAGLGKAFCLL